MITPADVKQYTVFEAVKERSDEQLVYDILQAASDIYAFAGHRFEGPKYAILPQEVQLAFIKVAEYYALVNSDESIAKGYTSEKLSDYSYTIMHGTAPQKFSLATLLAGHIEIEGTNRIRFRLRSV